MLPSTKPHQSKNVVSASKPSPIGASDSARKIPFGLPVVPEE